MKREDRVAFIGIFVVVTLVGLGAIVIGPAATIAGLVGMVTGVLVAVAVIQRADAQRIAREYEARQAKLRTQARSEDTYG